MKLGLQVPNFTWPGGPATLGADLATIARAADDAGFEYLALPDHLFQMAEVQPVESEMLEAYTTLGFLAAHTDRIKLLTIVTAAHHRQPGVLAKTITTLDVLSGGRAVFGIGAGWNEDESRGLGLPFPPTAERFELLEETVQFMLKMWSRDESGFESTHIHAERLLNSPQALTKPHPPILIGGGGEKKTLRLVAKYADMCNLLAGPELERKLNVLRKHCETVGRNFSDIAITTMGPLSVGKHGEGLDDFNAGLREQARLGVDVAVVGSLDGPDLDVIDLLGKEVIPDAADY
ncbi:LLM class F420-dependent oxidoreductase [Mycobacterium colombiense]|uniref:LLM class F420-dependent oxidoreductase n=1 Tax=Mycobacterium colombiense TaxID=339268 RepID=UPI0007F02FBE|nr:LLM class F420-dependent oxidoreductase [Mycobacterium colombiense]OBK67138.1 LLM class F420-dependent oxidoreductase [Mycobacterium colombiense]